MKVIAAYLLALLGGNLSPSADDLKNILGSGAIQCPATPRFQILAMLRLYNAMLFCLNFCMDVIVPCGDH